MTNAEHIRRYRAEAVLAGLCQVCRCRPPKSERKTCQACLDRGYARKKTKRGRKANNRYQRASASRRVVKRKAAGLCIYCGKTPPEASYVGCRPCLDKIAARTLATYRRHGSKPDTRTCRACGKVGHIKTRCKAPLLIDVPPRHMMTSGLAEVSARYWAEPAEETT